MEKSIEEKPQTLTIKETTSIDNFKKGVDTLLAQRDYFIKQVLPKLKEKQDYYTILGKKSLAKGGAEKLASIYNLVATFEKDAETVQMLGEIKGMVCYICNLSRDDKIIGQGRGADTLQRNQNDPNKTIKMAQKRAYVDAVIRTTGLSDIFTQDMCPEDRPDLWNENGTQKKVSVQQWGRQEFKKQTGYSTATNYRFGGGDIRQQVLKRDNYSCILCGMTAKEHEIKWNKPITVDHIDKNIKNNTLENLQTLCLSCHGKKDISPELTEQQVVNFKDEILKRRDSGETYQKIADDLKFSTASIWKWVKIWEQQPSKTPYNARNYQKGNIPPTKQAIINQKAKQAPELTPIQKLSVKLKENGCYNEKTKKFDDTKVAEIISTRSGVVINGQVEASKMAKEILELWK